MKHINSLSSGVALGSAGIVLMSVLSGCSSQEEQKKEQNKFLVIEQLTNGKYVVVEEMPTQGPTRAIIRSKDANGTVSERVMSEEEMKNLASQEYDKYQKGGSELNKEGGSGEGMGLAGTILAVAAGSLLGNMIGNALMNNSHFANKANSVNRSAYSRSAAGGSSTASKSSTSKSFFGGSGGSSKTSSSSSFGG
jgi:hypothetical protein